MNKLIYKDNEFELAIDDEGLYLCWNGERYELSSHYYEPCAYIKSQDGTVDIAMHGAFDFGWYISTSKGWISDKLSPLQLCEILKDAIVKEKEKK